MAVVRLPDSAAGKLESESVHTLEKGFPVSA